MEETHKGRANHLATGALVGCLATLLGMLASHARANWPARQAAIAVDAGVIHMKNGPLWKVGSLKNDDHSVYYGTHPSGSRPSPTQKLTIATGFTLPGYTICLEDSCRQSVVKQADGGWELKRDGGHWFGP